VTPAADASKRVGAGLRAIGLLLDWVLCMLISSAAFPMQGAPDGGVERVLLSGQPLATLGIWAVQHFILVATIGTTIGHRVVGVRVTRADGAVQVGAAKAAIRTVLIALVIPALVWDAEGKPLHDRASGTVMVRTRG